MPVAGGVGPPRRRVYRDRGSARRVAWARVAAHRRAVSGDPPLSVSNSLSGRHWELDQVPAVGDLTDIVQLGTGHHVSAGEGQRRVALQRRVAAHLCCRRPDARRHATLPRSWIQRENWEFETHSARQYFFLTNIKGTAHPSVGSIDKAHEQLTETFGIPTHVWWRDDLDRRLDQSADIKWSYPELLKATDLLPLLIRTPEDTRELQSARVLKSYVAAQYQADSDVKFKQVDLKRKLTDLFVDLPLAHKRPLIEQEHRRRRFSMNDSRDIDDYINRLHAFEDYGFEDEHPFNNSGLAGSFLLQMPLSKGVSRIVIEGAPGQGKSTVTQFLCQVNRLRLLQSVRELKTIADEHKNGPTRAPFRIDLRDYATWVSGRHPFTSTREQPVPDPKQQSLESFLVMQVNCQAGGMQITQDELLQFFSRSHSVIVLDGFDEVADIAARKQIVDEICKAAARLNAHAKSMQIIVTSRPAAFANSPGFPEDDWLHLQLKDLRRSNIEAYKKKWIEAQELSNDEGRLETVRK